MNLRGEELRMFIKRYLVVYIHQDTKRMKYAALTKIEQLVAEEPPKEIVYNIQAIISIQMWYRMILAKRKVSKVRLEYAGMLTRFMMEKPEGKKIYITVWKTLVEHKTTKKKTRHV